jgi:C4-dicarboxylate-specific signal transduction histidine kinase
MLATSAILLLMALPVTTYVSSSSSTNNTATAATLTDLNQTGGASEETIDVYQNPLVGILANELETRINKSGAILEITSRLSEVNSAPFASSISPELHGIPRDADTPKRKVAQDILDIDKDFEVIYFLMPNGDMYLEEPYSRQENLTRSNFAFRDYFRGALDSRDTYLGDIIISASSGRPQANIAVPIYSEDNETLVGVWAAGLNITLLGNSLQSLNLTNNDQRVVYLDQQGQKIADSNSQSHSSPLANNTSSNESFANLQAFKNAINGQSGSTTEMINGKMMLISYHPMKAFSNVWAILFMEPCHLAETGKSSSNVSMLSSPLIVISP